MTVKLASENLIELSGTCPLEDAELLFQHLSENPAAIVDWNKCEQAHAAVIQVIMASHCSLEGHPAGSFLRVFVEPALRRVRKPDSAFPG